MSLTPCHISCSTNLLCLSKHGCFACQPASFFTLLHQVNVTKSNAGWMYYAVKTLKEPLHNSSLRWHVPLLPVLSCGNISLTQLEGERMRMFPLSDDTFCMSVNCGSEQPHSSMGPPHHPTLICLLTACRKLFILNTHRDYRRLLWTLSPVFPRAEAGFDWRPGGVGPDDSQTGLHGFS